MNITRVLVVALCSFMAFLAMADSDIFISDGIKNGEQGQGWLFSRNNQCYAVTAKHVVERSEEIHAIIPRPGSGKYERPAKVCAKFKQQYDLALLSVAGLSTEECGGIFAVGDTDEALIRTGIPAFLRAVQADTGGVKATGLQVVYESSEEQAHFRVRGKELRQGFSGAMVYGYGSPGEKERPLGLFSNIRDNFGTVLRRHSAFLAISELFNGNQQDVEWIDPACIEPHEQEASVSATEGNIAAASCGATIFETPLSYGNGHSSRLLIAPAEQGGYWQAKQSDQNCVQNSVNRCPLQIEIDLCGGDTLRSIHEIRLSGKNIPDKSFLPIDVQLYAKRSSSEAQYDYVGGGQINRASAMLTIIANNPRLARRLLLEIYPERGDLPVTLERVEVFE
jgi:hypothetical protein